MQFDFEFPRGMDPTVQKYLETPLENSDLTETKMKNILQEQHKAAQKVQKIGNINELKVKALDIYQSKPIKQIADLDWTSVKVPEGKAKMFQAGLGEFNKRGEIGKHIFGVGFKSCSPDLKLDNTTIMWGGEVDAIKLLTSENYLLINGTLDGDKTSLCQWVNFRNDNSLEYYDQSLEQLEQPYLIEAQKHVPEIANLAASGINKLPPSWGLIYRGDAMTNEQLDEWRKGDKIMITTKFMSCSTEVDIGEKFAKESAEDYIMNTGKEYRPVLYAFISQSSKNISSFSVYPSEGERIYTPSQAFRGVAVDEQSVPGLAIIFLEELK